jgi:two-component system response regulator EvgA
VLRSRAVVVDDHPLVRLAVKVLLEENNYDVIAESSDGIDAQKIVEHHHPDILIIDADIPAKDGIEVIGTLRRKEFEGIIIMISGKNAEYYSPLAAQAGANGFVSKQKSLTEIVSAIRAGENGYSYFPAIKRVKKSDECLEQQKKIDALSPQEFRVFQLIIEGLKNNHIADKMHISNKTVSTYKTRVMEKLQCESVKELYDFAKKHNLD